MCTYKAAVRNSFVSTGEGRMIVHYENYTQLTEESASTPLCSLTFQTTITYTIYTPTRGVWVFLASENEGNEDGFRN